MSKKVLIITGGTGGHITPAISLGEELIKRQIQIAFIVDQRFHQFPFKLPESAKLYSIKAQPFFNKSFRQKVWFCFSSIISIMQALRIILVNKPTSIISFGGYICFPTLIAAIILRKPYVLHEQNAILGRANRFFAGQAKWIITCFETCQLHTPRYRAKMIYAGLPVRQDFLALREENSYKLPEAGALHILVIGGSQGAKIFDKVLPQALEALESDLTKIKVTQLCYDQEEVEAVYRRLGIQANLSKFFVDISQKLLNADLIIARAGASTIAEIIAIGRASILVPFPEALDNHQFFNAKWLSEQNAAWCLSQNENLAVEIKQILAQILEDPRLLETKAQAAYKSFVNGQIKLADIIETI